jgi:transcriptional antiterminator Rof (Rho-off)
MMTDYKPISCALYAQFEHWIIRRRTLRVVWREPRSINRLEQLKPLDLQTRNHEEFLIARRDNGETVELRLDRIVRAEPI